MALPHSLCTTTLQPAPLPTPQRRPHPEDARALMTSTPDDVLAIQEEGEPGQEREGVGVQEQPRPLLWSEPAPPRPSSASALPPSSPSLWAAVRLNRVSNLFTGLAHL